MAGKVVHIAYEYETFVAGTRGIGREARVVPVVRFPGEDQPRTIDSHHNEKYKE